MDELLDVCNEGLASRKKRLCSKEELLKAIGLIMAAAFYQTSITALTDLANRDVYSVGALNVPRLMDIIRGMGGRKTDVEGGTTL